MEVRYVLAAASCMSAFCCATFSLWGAMRYLDSQTRTHVLQKRAGLHTRMRVLQTGLAGINGVSGRLLGIGAVDTFTAQVCRALQLRGVVASSTGVVSCILLACFLVLAVCAATGRAALGVLCAVGLVGLVSAWSSRAHEARQEKMRDALPDALQAMSSCFGAGFTLLQTFEHLEHEVAGPLGAVFGDAAHALQTGGSVDSALSRMRVDAGLPELSFVSVALAVQHQTGGSMQRVLDATRESLKEELDLKRSLRVHTAQAKLSARVVVGVTVGLVGIMMLLSRDFLTPFFTSPAGMGMLACAVSLQVMGIVAVRRLLKVGVE